MVLVEGFVGEGVILGVEGNGEGEECCCCGCCGCNCYCCDCEGVEGVCVEGEGENEGVESVDEVVVEMYVELVLFVIVMELV